MKARPLWHLVDPVLLERTPPMKAWLLEPSRVSVERRLVLRWLMIPAIAGFILLICGLVWLSVWPTLFGATLIVLTQLP